MKHLLVAIVVCAVAGHAAADSVPTRARTLAERGRAAHDARDYAGAIAAFTEAYAIAPAPALLFNLAQAYRLAGRCDDASLMYRRFLASSPSDDARGLAELHLLHLVTKVSILSPAHRTFRHTLEIEDSLEVIGA